MRKRKGLIHRLEVIKVFFFFFFFGKISQFQSLSFVFLKYTRSVTSSYIIVFPVFSFSAMDIKLPLL